MKKWNGKKNHKHAKKPEWYETKNEKRIMVGNEGEQVQRDLDTKEEGTILYFLQIRRTVCSFIFASSIRSMSKNFVRNNQQNKKTTEGKGERTKNQPQNVGTMSICLDI